MHLDEYAAGFFDGEGCIAITREQDKIYRLSARVTNTHSRVLGILEGAFGGNVNVQGDTRKFARPRWCWTIRSWGAVKFLNTILPELRIKREQAELVLEFWKSQVDWAGKPLTPSEIARREEAKRALSLMKDDVASHGSAVGEAYVAGFFDAEGSVSLASIKTSHALQVRISNTVRSVLDLIAMRFGGGVCVKDTAGRDGYNRKIAWTWYLQGASASRFLSVVLPHLIVKREQAVLGIEYQAEKEKLPRKKRGEFGRSYRQKILGLNKKQTTSASP